MSANVRLQDALDKALESAARVFPSIAKIGVALVKLGGPAPHAMAHQNGSVMYFGASMMKVAALYSLYELRTTLRAIAKELGCRTGVKEFFSQVERYLDPQIIQYTKKRISALAGIPSKFAIPHYSKAFKVVENSDRTLAVDFSDAFSPRPFSGGEYRPHGKIELMIAESHNESAAACIQACGYGYIAGALAEGGHFDPGTGRGGVGIWLGGDYLPDSIPSPAKDGTRIPNPASYPTYLIDTANGVTEKGTTALHCARMLTLLADKRLFGGEVDVNNSMLDVMAKSVLNGHVYITRTTQSPSLSFETVCTKLGHASSGKSKIEHYSECSILRHRSGTHFVLVWLNLVWIDGPNDEMNVFSHAISNAMDAYLAR